MPALLLLAQRHTNRSPAHRRVCLYMITELLHMVQAHGTVRARRARAPARPCLTRRALGQPADLWQVLGVLGDVVLAVRDTQCIGDEAVAVPEAARACPAAWGVQGEAAEQGDSPVSLGTESQGSEATLRRASTASSAVDDAAFDAFHVCVSLPPALERWSHPAADSATALLAMLELAPPEMLTAYFALLPSSRARKVACTPLLPLPMADPVCCCGACRACCCCCCRRCGTCTRPAPSPPPGSP